MLARKTISARPDSASGKAGMEVGEDAKLGEERVAGVQVEVIAPAPVERLCRATICKPSGNDAARLQFRDVRLGKVRRRRRRPD